MVKDWPFDWSVLFYRKFGQKNLKYDRNIDLYKNDDTI
jgi:hypothetical protein